MIYFELLIGHFVDLIIVFKRTTSHSRTDFNTIFKGILGYVGNIFFHKNDIQRTTTSVMILELLSTCIIL